MGEKGWFLYVKRFEFLRVRFCFEDNTNASEYVIQSIVHYTPNLKLKENQKKTF